MSMIDPPSTNIGLEWWNKAYVLLFAIQESGLSANRPVKNLYVGRTYYATDLGYHISFHALGTPNVWHKPDGTSV